MSWSASACWLGVKWSPNSGFTIWDVVSKGDMKIHMTKSSVVLEIEGDVQATIFLGIV